MDESFTEARSFHALVTSAGGESGGFTCSRSANPATGHVIEPTLSRPPMQSSHIDIKNILGLLYEAAEIDTRDGMNTIYSTAFKDSSGTMFTPSSLKIASCCLLSSSNKYF